MSIGQRIKKWSVAWLGSEGGHMKPNRKRIKKRIINLLSRLFPLRELTPLQRLLTLSVKRRG